MDALALLSIDRTLIDRHLVVLLRWCWMPHVVCHSDFVVEQRPARVALVHSEMLRLLLLLLWRPLLLLRRGAPSLLLLWGAVPV